MILKLKIFIKYLISYIIALFIVSSRDIKSKSILLVRLDAIGDYILFRNFIQEIKESDKYKGYDISLVGNIAWKNLAQELDDKYIDSYIWIDRSKFSKSLLYRYNKLKEITTTGYEIVINSSYSRDFFDSDNIIKLVYATQRIAIVGDMSNCSAKQKKISDEFYTKLIPTEDIVKFEFERNKVFFEKLLEVKLDIKAPSIKLINKEYNSYLPNKKYVVIFIGASASFRKWDIQKYAYLAGYLKEKYDYEIVLCGGIADVIDANKFKLFFKYHYIDLVGKTSLLDLLHVIKSGDMMIANETSAPHIAVALGGIKIFVISNGNHFGRFSPYPKNITSKYYAIYPSIIRRKLDSFKELSNTYKYGSELNINDIAVEVVKEKIDKVLYEEKYAN